MIVEPREPIIDEGVCLQMRILSPVSHERGRVISCAGCDKKGGTLLKVDEGVYLHRGCTLKPQAKPKEPTPLTDRLYKATRAIPQIVVPKRKKHDARLGILTR